MDKLVATVAEAVADITDGSSLAVWGFGLCGIPEALIAALALWKIDRSASASAMASRATP